MPRPHPPRRRARANLIPILAEPGTLALEPPAPAPHPPIGAQKSTASRRTGLVVAACSSCPSARRWIYLDEPADSEDLEALLRVVSCPQCGQRGAMVWLHSVPPGP